MEGNATPRRFLYDGFQVVGEYPSGGGTIVNRYVPGAGLDDIAAYYTGSGTGTRHFPLADERLSVIGIADGSGTATINAYDEYGTPAPGNTGRFQYTGQVWLADAGLQYSRMRTYAPGLGRFVQADPIGYQGGANLYAYVRADPVNLVDPMGTTGTHITPGRCAQLQGTVIRTRSDSVDHDVCLTGGINFGPSTTFRGDGDPTRGGSGGWGGTGQDPSPQEQEEICRNDPVFRGVIGNSTFEKRAQRAMSLALSTPPWGPNRGHGSEHGFFVHRYPWGTYIGSTFTSRLELHINPGLGFYPGATVVIIYHTHQSEGTGSVGHLSDKDFAWSRARGIPIIAERRDGRRYCFVP